MKHLTNLYIQVFIFLFLAPAFIYETSAQAIKKGRVERVIFHSKSLEANLAGDTPDRDVSVYLPPSYFNNPKKRYPVVYYLHGFSDDDAKWYGMKKHWINLPAILDSVYAKGKLQECIFVTPNGYTKFAGSFYSNSVTTGNWEEFIAKELVSYIDGRFRTIPRSSARGLAGHSMGGYGTMRIGEKNPDVFAAIYLLSPAIFIPGTTPSITRQEIDNIKTFDDLQKANFWTKAAFSLAAAWSPNPNNPPFYLDLPGTEKADVIPVNAKWTANLPLASLDQFVGNLKQLKGIAFDAGDRDVNFAAAIRILDKELNAYKIKHDFEIYKGDHTNKIHLRISDKVLPFFSQTLKP
ncbi:alpha/beta hydrolase [Desertivirga brevis]|uniref:alpha/beta hydrolase n=1 Tax=Desertivirga brevis TaxID=2810310 RepID=UPI001A96DD13|nr:alpha/beta hydrolase-fold protein [Pedobacter sp. SYSU D00873]